MPRRPWFASQGFSLIELMVGMVIGLLLIIAFLSVYTEGNNIQRVTSRELEMADKGRFALDLMSRDIHLAGFLGPVSSLFLVTDNNNIAAQMPANCFANMDPSPQAVMQHIDNAGATLVVACGIQTPLVAGSDMLLVRYSEPVPIADNQLQSNFFYVRANPQGGAFFSGTNIPQQNGLGLNLGQDNPYTLGTIENANNPFSTNQVLRTFVYYLSQDSVPGDGIPSLRRLDISGLFTTDTLLVDGVEDLQFRFGITQQSDPLQQANSSLETYQTTLPDNFAQLRTTEIWLRLRTLEPTRAAAQSFDFSYWDQTAPQTLPADRLNRLVLSTVALIRNAQ